MLVILKGNKTFLSYWQRKFVRILQHAFEWYQITGKKKLKCYIRSIQYFDKEDSSQ